MRCGGEKALIQRDGISVGILAGGYSTRMGQDKALLPWKDTTFIGHLCSELSGFPEVLISCREPEKFADIPYPKVVDEREGFGPVEGIRRLLVSASYEDAFICAVDMPFVTKELVNFLCEKKKPDSGCLAVRSERGIEPLCAIYNKSILPELETMVTNDEHRMKELFTKINLQTVALSEGGFSDDAVRNLNTPQEYRTEME